MTITFSATIGNKVTKLPIERTEINAFLQTELAKLQDEIIIVEAEWNGILYPSHYSKEGVVRLLAHNTVNLSQS